MSNESSWPTLIGYGSSVIATIATRRSLLTDHAPEVGLAVGLTAAGVLGRKRKTRSAALWTAVLSLITYGFEKRLLD